MRPQRTGNTPATRRQPAGKDNFAPAEDLHNKNPSLVALGKEKMYFSYAPLRGW